MPNKTGLRDRAERGRNQLRQAGRAALAAPALTRTVEWFIRLLLGAVLAGGRVLGGRAPFGIAFVGACGAGSGGFAALLGAVFGYLVSLGLEEGLRYGAGAILTFSVSFAFYDVALYRRGWFMPLVAGALNALTGFVTVSGGRWSGEVAVLLTGEGVLTAVGTYAFHWAFTLWEGGSQGREATLRQRVGLVVLALAALISLAEPEVLGAVSLGRLCACVMTLVAAFAAGPGGGAAVGVAAGLAMDLAAGELPFYGTAYALSGLVAGLARRRGRLWTALCYLLAGSGGALWGRQGLGVMGPLWEMGLAGFLFLLLPQRVLTQAGLLFSRGEGSGQGETARREAARRLGDAAAAFGQVSAALGRAFGRPGENWEDPSVVYDRAANRVCGGCPLRERCWQSGYQDTFDQLNGAMGAILEAGRAEAEHFPQRFRDRCVKFPAFLAAVDGEVQTLLLRRRYAVRVGESRRAVCRQYGEVAQVLEEAAQAVAAPLTADPRRTRRLGQFLAARGLRCGGLVFYDDQGHLQLQLEGPDAAELLGDTGRESLGSLLGLPLAEGEAQGEERVVYRQREPLTVTAGVAGRSRKGQGVSGDAGRWFKDGRGMLYLLLCDGMGSGPEARRESDLAAELLEKFLRAGVTAENALGTLDQALVLRGEETGGFSTIDLLSLDLYTGQGTLYKLGAAPSYLKRGGAVTRLTGTALPAGVTAGGSLPPPDRASFQVGPGDCVILLTDGVLDGEDEWLRAALSSFDGGSPAALAEELVAHDREDRDDKTAFVLRVGLRGDAPAGRPRRRRRRYEPPGPPDGVWAVGTGHGREERNHTGRRGSGIGGTEQMVRVKQFPLAGLGGGRSSLWTNPENVL